MKLSLSFSTGKPMAVVNQNIQKILDFKIPSSTSLFSYSFELEKRILLESQQFKEKEQVSEGNDDHKSGIQDPGPLADNQSHDKSILRKSQSNILTPTPVAAGSKSSKKASSKTDKLDGSSNEGSEMESSKKAVVVIDYLEFEHGLAPLNPWDKASTLKDDMEELSQVLGGSGLTNGASKSQNDQRSNSNSINSNVANSINSNVANSNSINSNVANSNSTNSNVANSTHFTASNTSRYYQPSQSMPVSPIGGPEGSPPKTNFIVDGNKKRLSDVPPVLPPKLSGSPAASSTAIRSSTSSPSLASYNNVVQQQQPPSFMAANASSSNSMSKPPLPPRMMKSSINDQISGNGNSGGNSADPSNPSPIPKLPPRPNKIVSKYVSMGHAESNIMKAIEIYGESEKKILNFLELRKKFPNTTVVKSDLISEALNLYDYMPTIKKAEDYLQAYVTLKEFGFKDSAIKEALVMNDAQRDLALDYLTQQLK